MAASLFKWFFAGIFLVAPETWGGGVKGTAAEAMKGKHPFYVSVTEIGHIAKEKTLEISCKMFTNDLETVLEKSTHIKVDLSQKKDRTVADKLIGEYVLRHLQIKVDGKAAFLHMIGSEQEAEATWGYFQADNIPAVKRMDISNSLLYDGFEQEINIIHVTVGGIRKSTKVTAPDANTFLEF
jgi:hypothetical protein